MTVKKQALIIGSGFGGLAAAIRLQAMGMQVTLIEKRKQVGGRAYQFKEKGYTFDMGPSSITAPSIFEDLFAVANRRFSDEISLIPLDPFYRIYYHDRTYIDYNSNPDQMMAQMAQFNLKDAKEYPYFMEAIKPLYHAVIVKKLGAKPYDKLWKMLALIPTLLKNEAYLPAYFYTKRFFQDYRHRFLFSFHPLFIGGNPFKVPAMYLMIPYLEKQQGVHFTKGGMYRIVEACRDLFLDLGGILRLNEECLEIKTHLRQVKGVRTTVKFYEADLVVSNADVGFTYRCLIDQGARRKWSNKRLDKLRYGMSCYVLYLGVKKQYQILKHHTLILSARYKSLLSDIFDRKVLASDFSMYLHAPSKTDPSMAPRGCESLYILIPVPNLEGDVDWHVERNRLTQSVIAFLEDWGLTDLKKSIQVCRSFTPLEFENELNTPCGSAFSLEPKFFQTAFFRPQNRSEDIKHLYFVGAGTHPGPGVPGVVLSAEATEQAIRKDFHLSE